MEERGAGEGKMEVGREPKRGGVEGRRGLVGLKPSEGRGEEFFKGRGEVCFSLWISMYKTHIHPY